MSFAGGVQNEDKTMLSLELEEAWRERDEARSLAKLYLTQLQELGFYRGLKLPWTLFETRRKTEGGSKC